MTKLSLITALYILFTVSIANAQDKVTIPNGNLKAFEKQTRQKDGYPGKNYWQNSSDYNLKAEVDVANKLIKGSGSITYHNNSNDTLRTIVFRLYQDLFRKGGNRHSMVPVDPADIHDGVNITSLQVDNIAADEKQIKRQGTLMMVRLKKPMPPHSKLNINIDWNFSFPQKTLIRMGTIDSTTMFVAQWYPQIAVYDDIYGWDTRSYNGMAEFYNDFNNYDVEIKVPDNYMVWATGEALNMKELLHADIYSKYTKAAASDEINHVITSETLKRGNITTNAGAWKYKAQNVPDFAFGLSNHYLWDVTSVITDKTTGKRTTIGVAYHENGVHFERVASIARETIKALSEEMPGIPYPFPYLTAFQGDFGMEYPMITNVGPDEDFGTTVYAHSHEIAHAYFPFLVGTNETKNGWIDEGLVVFMPEKVQTKLSPGFDIAKSNTHAFSIYAGMEDEPALITPTHYLDPKVYFILNYAKSEQVFRMLEIELGSELFKECLLAFIDRWKYKHPTPIDLFNTFSDVSKQDLNWYWSAWLYKVGGIPDMAITNVKINKNRYDITVSNKGDLPLPLMVSLYNGDKLVTTINEKGKRWLTGNEIVITADVKEKITKVVLGSEVIPDAKPQDNEFVVK